MVATRTSPRFLLSVAGGDARRASPPQPPIDATGQAPHAGKFPSDPVAGSAVGCPSPPQSSTSTARSSTTTTSMPSRGISRCAGWDVLVPVWRVHRAVGIGSDRIVAHLGGDRLEDDRGDEVREHESEIFGSMKDGVAAIEGATEFVRALNEGGRSVVLASSGDEGDIEGFLDLLEIRDDVDGWSPQPTSTQTKPDPDLIEAALETGGWRLPR